VAAKKQEAGAEVSTKVPQIARPGTGDQRRQRRRRMDTVLILLSVVALVVIVRVDLEQR